MKWKRKKEELNYVYGGLEEFDDFQEIRERELDEVKNILNKRKLITMNNRAFKPKYTSIESYKPLFIKFYCGSKNRLKPSDERYLKKRIIEELEMEGVPLFFKILSNILKNAKYYAQFRPIGRNPKCSYQKDDREIHYSQTQFE